MPEPKSVPISSRISGCAGSLLTASFESIARISLGQTILKLMDRVLWVVEKSAQWSLPVQEVSSDENGKIFGEIEVVRPLPWILFLPGLILLRVVRIGINIGAFILGYPQIQPSSIVKFLQKRRRQLRTIKYSGLKSMRTQRRLTGEDKGWAKNEARKSLIKSIQLTLSTLSCLDGYRNSPSPPPTRIQVFNNFDTVTTETGEKQATEMITTQPTDSKRKFVELISSSDDSCSEDETLKSRIDRLASIEDSDDDPDFNPGGYMTGDSSDSSFGEDVSITEATELLVEAKTDLTELNKFPNKTEVEAILVEKTKEILTPENTDTRHGVEISEGQENYYSPNNFVTDGDMAFYSPISSKSVSPERSNSPIKQSQLRGTNAKSNDINIGDLKLNVGPVDSVFDDTSENDFSRVSRKDVTNGHVEEKKSTHVGKFNHKHRRSSHGNRKKK